MTGLRSTEYQFLLNLRKLLVFFFEKKVVVRCAVVTLLMTIAAVGVWVVKTNDPIKNDGLYNFPMIIDGWIGREIPMEDWVYESLETPYALLREYTLQGQKKISLAIVWYDDREIAFHAPESCLGGIGIDVKEKTVHAIGDGTEEKRIGRLVVERDNINWTVLYYFITDGYITPDQTPLRIKILLERLKLNRTSAAFIRIMAPRVSSEGNAIGTLENFFRITFPLVIEYTNTSSALKSKGK